MSIRNIQGYRALMGQADAVSEVIDLVQRDAPHNMSETILTELRRVLEDILTEATFFEDVGKEIMAGVEFHGEEDDLDVLWRELDEEDQAGYVEAAIRVTNYLKNEDYMV